MVQFIVQDTNFFPNTRNFLIPRRYLSDGVAATCMCLNNNQDAFVGTDSGQVFRCNLGGQKVWPTYYALEDTGNRTDIILRYNIKYGNRRIIFFFILFLFFFYRLLRKLYVTINIWFSPRTYASCILLSYRLLRPPTTKIKWTV